MGDTDDILIREWCRMLGCMYVSSEVRGARREARALHATTGLRARHLVALPRALRLRADIAAIIAALRRANGWAADRPALRAILTAALATSLHLGANDGTLRGATACLASLRAAATQCPALWRRTKRLTDLVADRARATMPTAMWVAFPIVLFLLFFHGGPDWCDGPGRHGAREAPLRFLLRNIHRHVASFRHHVADIDCTVLDPRSRPHGLLDDIHGPRHLVGQRPRLWARCAVHNAKRPRLLLLFDSRRWQRLGQLWRRLRWRWCWCCHQSNAVFACLGTAAVLKEARVRRPRR
mmetsp:Transcript_30176/g.76334  ORF Transcript_30176/g.76334 Transcript_30176/m.76334 type:complete len:296 (-) Transcript_30176:203-1090(-)